MSVEDSAPLALVTAGARRLGKALVLKLAELGYDVALHYNESENDAEITAREVRQLGRQCELFRRNFRNFDEILTLLTEVHSRMGTPNLLVNNASIFVPNTLKDTRPEDYDADFAVHLKAPFFLMRDFAGRCEQGHIINIVDTAVDRNGTGYFTYLLSKKALLDLTLMAANELAPGIRVNAIAPGIILPAVGWDKGKSDRVALDNPLQRKSGPADVAMALEYLLKAEQVTGECLYVDSGAHVSW
jgi:pteridine reductase